MAGLAPARYQMGPDGEMRRTWNGKLPEEFSEQDTLFFLADTDIALHGRVSADTLAAIHAAGYDYKGGAFVPRPRKEHAMSKNDDVLLTPEQIAAEEKRWIFEAPIAEMAEVMNLSIDEAVKLRVEKNLEEAPMPIDVTVRPIEPQGKILGFASVNFGGVVVDDFKIVEGKNGLFLGAPSKPDPTSRTGYRSTVRITDQALQERLNTAAADSYHMAVEKLLARAEAIRPTPIKEQMANAAKEADRANAQRPAPAKGKEARNDR